MKKRKVVGYSKLLTSIFLLFNINSSFSKNISEINSHSFSFNNIDGELIELKNFKNKVILVVNTASQCGFSGQYKELQDLYNKYHHKGLEIIAVPSKDFGNQEFGEKEKTKNFVEKKFDIKFKLTSLNKVKGENAHPFYIWANEKAGFFGSPKWNFHKYLIDKNGNFVNWFSSSTSPVSPILVQEIEKELAK